MYRFAYKYSDEIIFYFDSAGNKYVASGGSLAWRINNPGLVRSRSHFSYRNGAIGNYESYAIFADATCGRKALVAWLHSKKYFESSLQALGKHYYPKNPEKFVDQLTAIAKLPSNCKVGALNKEEFDRLILGIEKLCGYSSRGDETIRLLPKIIAKIENGEGKEDSYLIGDNTVLSKDDAIQWVLTHRLDAVVVHGQNDEIHLRSRPHYSFRRIRFHGKQSLDTPKLPEINTLVRVAGKKQPGQVIWGFINGIDNTEVYARKLATLISDAADGEQVLSMPNDTICKAVDLAICGTLKVGIDTPLVKWTVQFLRYLLDQAEKSKKFVIVFAHSLGAIYLEHALELMNPQERKLLRIFTFGGGSYIEPVKCHPDSHNYASAADFVCRFVSPNQQWLALQRYYGHKDGLNDAQVIYKLAFEDATLHLDTTDVKVWEIFIKKRERHYEQEFSKINHITILDPDPDSNNWKHEFISNCYQAKIKERIKTYKGM
ncbi:MAG: hypothetical protein WCF65_07215 [Parachlamydiaceae bacterium]